MTRCTFAPSGCNGPMREWLEFEWPDYRRVWDAMLAARPKGEAQ